MAADDVNSAAPAPTFIDLFSGCGGFTLGMLRAGFDCLAAVDFNHEAVTTLRANLPDVRHALEKDLTAFGPADLAGVIGTKSVDVIVGGPPCQGFSLARQRDGSNHGSERHKSHDPRRQLYREFLRYVDHFRPRVFVMENVLGLRNAAGGAYFTAVQKEARDLGYRVHPQVEDSFKLGVPQKRHRQLIVGVRLDVPGYFLPELKPAPRARTDTFLGDAIMDLPVLRADDGEDVTEYDFARRREFVCNSSASGHNYLFGVLEVSKADKLTNHVARPHSDRDLRDFARLPEGRTSADMMRQVSPAR
jgi:DNA (cytosine-5)-methyltransferase 1